MTAIRSLKDALDLCKAGYQPELYVYQTLSGRILFAVYSAAEDIDLYNDPNIVAIERVLYEPLPSDADVKPL